MKKLLLIDDDIALRKQFCFTFEKEYEIHEASNAKEALDIMDKIKFDIALVDLGLPPYENSHHEGRLIISKFLLLHHTKIIVLTGQESREYAKELIDLGVFDYLIKPVNIPTLSASLKRASFFIDNEAKRYEDGVKLSFKANFADGLKNISDEAQKQLLLAVLKKTDFNIYQSAKILGISRENCYYFLKKFGIERADA